jgi:hypothetical protein
MWKFIICILIKMAKANFILSHKIVRNDDPEDAMAEDNPLQYKGVFYGNDSDQKYYQGGAHFDYKDLCRRLNNFIESTTLLRNEVNNENGNTKADNNLIKDKANSRNRNIIIANSNTMKTAAVIKTSQVAQGNGNLKSVVMNYKKPTINNSGAEANFNPGMINYKNKNLFAKQVEYYSKIVESKKKSDDKICFVLKENIKTNSKLMINAIQLAQSKYNFLI